jgi:hypothetical protein
MGIEELQMGKMRSKARELLIVTASVAIAGMVYLTLQSCNDDPPLTETNCDNGQDEDLDGVTDCDDIDCLMDPICHTTDGDGDSDSDGDADGDRDQGDGGDGDADGDVESDTDGDGSTGPCDPDAGFCDWSCRADEECQLVFDTLLCCGGFPHRIGEDIDACVTATHRARLDVDRCALPWSPGAPIPSVPDGCTPFCDGVSCPQCPEVGSSTRAVCHEGECRALCADCCFSDDNCPAGSRCVDPTHEGQLRCVEGEHECRTDESCLSLPLYAECTECRCGDVTNDGFNDCACFGCGPDGGGPPPGTCTYDRDCDPHEFCVDRRCVFQGDMVCRVAMGDCGPCAFCEPTPDDSSAERGSCVPLDWGDAGPPFDAGCE